MKTDQKDCDTLPPPSEAEQTRTADEESNSVKEDVLKSEEPIKEAIKEDEVVKSEPELEQVKVKAEEKPKVVEDLKKTRRI